MQVYIVAFQRSPHRDWLGMQGWLGQGTCRGGAKAIGGDCAKGQCAGRRQTRSRPGRISAEGPPGGQLQRCSRAGRGRAGPWGPYQRASRRGGLMMPLVITTGAATAGWGGGGGGGVGVSRHVINLLCEVHLGLCAKIKLSGKAMAASSKKLLNGPQAALWGDFVTACSSGCLLSECKSPLFIWL